MRSFEEIEKQPGKHWGVLPPGFFITTANLEVSITLEEAYILNTHSPRPHIYEHDGHYHWRTIGNRDKQPLAGEWSSPPDTRYHSPLDPAPVVLDFLSALGF